MADASVPRGYQGQEDSCPFSTLLLGALGKGEKKTQTDPFKHLPPAEEEQEISIQINNRQITFLAHLAYVSVSLF